MGTKTRYVESVRFINADGEDSRSPQEDTVVMRYTFIGGESVDYRLDDLPDDVNRRLAWHGYRQKTGDGGTSAAAELGKDAPESARIAAYRQGVADVAELLRDGDWAEGGGPSRMALARALVRAAGEAGIELSIADARAKVPRDEESRKAMAAVPEVAAALMRLRAEALAAKAETVAGTAEGGLAELLG